MLAIRHVHERWMPYPRAQVSAALDPMWTGGAQDAFPHEHIRVWRRPAPEAAAAALAMGTRFGHGVFAFVVDRRDEHGFRARITTPGYEGWHGFELRDEPRDGVAGTHVTHELVANLRWTSWVPWTAVVGGIHDWAVGLILPRLERVIVSGAAGDCPPAPWQLRAFERVRRRMPRRPRHRSAT